MWLGPRSELTCRNVTMQNNSAVRSGGATVIHGHAVFESTRWISNQALEQHL